jgi:hypothetical protein
LNDRPLVIDLRDKVTWRKVGLQDTRRRHNQLNADAKKERNKPARESDLRACDRGKSSKISRKFGKFGKFDYNYSAVCQEVLAFEQSDSARNCLVGVCNGTEPARSERLNEFGDELIHKPKDGYASAKSIADLIIELVDERGL